MTVISNTLECKWSAQMSEAGGHERPNGMWEVTEITGSIVFRLALGDVLDKQRVEQEILASPDIAEFFVSKFASINENVASRMNWAVAKVAPVWADYPKLGLHAYDFTVQILSFGEDDRPTREMVGADNED